MHIWIHIPHNHGSILDFNWKCTSKYLGPIKAMGPMSYHPPIWSPSLNRPDNGHQEVSLGWHHLRHVMMAPFFESGFFERWDNVIISPSYLTIILFHFVSYVFWQFEVEFSQPSHWPKARFVETYKLRGWSSWSWNFVENDDHHYIISIPLKLSVWPGWRQYIRTPPHFFHYKMTNAPHQSLQNGTCRTYSNIWQWI